MAKLTPRQEEIYQLRKKGYSHKEVGEKLGISEGTSRQIVHEINLKVMNKSAKFTCSKDPRIKQKAIDIRKAALDALRGQANPSKSESEST